MSKLMDRLARCIGCGLNIYPLCASETGTIHYSCSSCGASFTDPRETRIYAECATYHYADGDEHRAILWRMDADGNGDTLASVVCPDVSTAESVCEALLRVYRESHIIHGLTRAYDDDGHPVREIVESDVRREHVSV